MSLRRITSADAEKVADFVDTRTRVLRWLVAFFRHLGELPEEEEPYWSLWRDGDAESSPRSLVLVHAFRMGATYICSEAGADHRPVESLCLEELFPEKMIGDRESMESWVTASPEFFERASEVRRIEVLEFRGEGDVPTGFRPARPDDLPVLEEYGRLYGVEAGEECTLDFESLLERELVFVWEDGGRVHGFVRSNLSDGKYVHGGGLYVHPRARGKGAAQALALGLGLRVRDESGARVILDAYEDNENALRAYVAAGYEKVGGGLEVGFAEGAWR